MHIMYFTEQLTVVPHKDRIAKTEVAAQLFSGPCPDRASESRLHNEYIEQYVQAEKVGVDGILLQAHQDVPVRTQAKSNMFAALLAGLTKPVEIGLLGSSLPLMEDPIRLAEELAMIDMISKGRLICSFVRRHGRGTLAEDVNSHHTQECFEEAHDLLIETWTQLSVRPGGLACFAARYSPRRSLAPPPKPSPLGRRGRSASSTPIRRDRPMPWRVS
jgi:alkanesulfonate monooxygenase SsuD/methylene tetrahydromethanopterin reductase-like flavin-dependent oxidoreductase (luciferase family)